MRLPSFGEDYWQLESGEERHRKSPDTFWIPPRGERENLRRGDYVQLLFQIEAADENGEIETVVERMWVMLTERIGHTYLGILDNQPACCEPEPDVYLQKGVEVPFLPEHVIDIAEAPSDYVEELLRQSPVHCWER
jgi:hypothetical protein